MEDACNNPHLPVIAILYPSASAGPVYIQTVAAIASIDDLNYHYFEKGSPLCMAIDVSVRGVNPYMQEWLGEDVYSNHYRSCGDVYILRKDFEDLKSKYKPFVQNFVHKIPAMVRKYHESYTKVIDVQWPDEAE
jgi:hypothetical protein